MEWNGMKRNEMNYAPCMMRYVINYVSQVTHNVHTNAHNVHTNAYNLKFHIKHTIDDYEEDPPDDP